MLRAYLQDYVGDVTESNADTLRLLAGLHAPVDTALVTLATVDSVCTRVTHAVDSAYGNTASPVTFIVFKIGPSYAARDQRVVSGTSVIFFVDSSFTYLNAIIF